jgi:glycosyltransferase involved in cell wall biosynthesis
VTTLHTPPTPWLESAIAVSREGQHFAAVSRHTADSWRHVLDDDAVVVPNGVDTELWPAGPGGTDLVWTGRITPEKGPHLAVEIARRAGRRLRLAGPLSDPVYWRAQVRPLLGDGIEYVGHVEQRALAALVGASAACLVTPRWDEPYGLVAAEAISCGTPVLGFARGGLPEVVHEGCARLVGPDDVAAAAAQVEEVVALDRGAARERAISGCSVEAMTQRYIELYAGLLQRPVAA